MTVVLYYALDHFLDCYLGWIFFWICCWLFYLALIWECKWIFAAMLVPRFPFWTFETMAGLTKYPPSTSIGYTGTLLSTAIIFEILAWTLWDYGLVYTSLPPQLVAPELLLMIDHWNWLSKAHLRSRPCLTAMF